MKTRPATLATALAALAALAGIGVCGDDTNDPASTDVTTTNVTTTDASLEIRYTHADADVEFSYGIECSASGSEVTGDVEQAEVDASAACRALTEPAVVDRLVDGPDHGVCTEIYGGPDVAEVSGTIGDQTVDTAVDRANGCAINDWDEILGDLLPPPIGVATEA